MIVYMATNKINNKVYIGQTVRELLKRIAQHLGSAKRGSCLPFHNAIRKYGEDAFTWEIIYHADNLQDLNNAEEYLIAEYQSRVKGYNVKFGGSNRRHPESTRRKISDALRGQRHSAERSARNGEAKKGVPLSIEHRMKIKAAQSGERHPMFGKKHTAEARRNMSAAHKGQQAGEENPSFDCNIYPFRHKDYGLAFCTQHALRKEFGMRSSTISMVIHGRIKSTRGWSLATPEYLQKLRESMGEVVCKQ